MPEKRLLTITPQQLEVSVLMREQGSDLDVGIRFQIDHKTTGFAENTFLAIRMTPSEARTLAALLNKKANAAEAG